MLPEKEKLDIKELGDSLALALKLRPCPAAGSCRALCCRGREITWLRRLCRRLPAKLFERIKAAGNQEIMFLLLPPGEGARFFPFSLRLKKMGERIFLPRDRAFSPALDPRLIEEKLELNAGQLCFISDNWRYDIEAGAFSPLSSGLLTRELPAVEIIAAPLEGLEEVPQIQAAAVPEDLPSPPASAETGGPSTTHQIRSPDPRQEPVEPKEILQEFAARLSREQDYLGAATCFSLAGDPRRAAECYRLAALNLPEE